MSDCGGGLVINGVEWKPPVGMDPAVSHESLLIGACVYSLTGDTMAAEKAALEHYYYYSAAAISSCMK
jgi:hypothetical protein